ncbi:hypothetical protein BDZ89DRAFT_1041602 [Hymenopellis radicata]|nr:hypothetical protein BDZ89DRAFT_1041602 [Hymenopellis radicata]
MTTTTDAKTTQGSDAAITTLTARRYLDENDLAIRTTVTMMMDECPDDDYDPPPSPQYHHNDFHHPPIHPPLPRGGAALSIMLHQWEAWGGDRALHARTARKNSSVMTGYNRSSAAVTKAAPVAKPTTSSSAVKPKKDTARSATTHSQPSFLPITPVLRPTQVLGPFITATLQQLVDEDRRQCMGELRGLSNYELDREDNILRNFLLLRKIDGEGTFKISSDLPPRGIFAGMRKKSVEELEEEREHAEEAERMRVDMEVEMIISADVQGAEDDFGGDVHMDVDADIPPLSSVDQAALKAIESELPDPSSIQPPPSTLSRLEDAPIIQPIEVPDPSSLQPPSPSAPSQLEAAPVIQPIEEHQDEDIEALDWDADMDTSKCEVESFLGLGPASSTPSSSSSRNEKLEWTGLEKKCGNDGLILVLGTLLWWGEVVFDGVSGNTPTADQVDWQLAVDDVTWAIEHIVRTTVVEVPGARASKKRVRADKENIDVEDTRIAKSLDCYERKTWEAVRINGAT